ncbi:hypothetical protein [Streptomyces clavifer]|uniref:hypothetical protein n=1 Tax=Streptomyces clavifer TaxID=68188 RepID=UPI003087E1FC|nr:hypothetical protein OG388_15845 [Streptomyces clavifer]
MARSPGRAPPCGSAPYSEVRYAEIRLAECPSDALRVAESRGMRLPYVPDEDEDTGDAPPGA